MKERGLEAVNWSCSMSTAGGRRCLCASSGGCTPVRGIAQKWECI